MFEWEHGRMAIPRRIPVTGGKASPPVPSGDGEPREGTNGMDGTNEGKETPKWAMSKRMSVLLTVSSVVLTTISLFLGVRYILNVRFLDAYDNGSYDAAVPHTLTYLNFPDPYLPYHNFGCASFMLGNYEYAAGAFAEALEHDPPHDEPYPSRECQVRINLALSLTRPLKLNGKKTEQEKKQLIAILTAAREYLTEDGCANPAKDVFDGHSEDAEQLKKDIDKAIEKLQDPNGGDEGDDSDDQDQSEDSGDDKKSESGGGGSQSEDRLKEKLNDRKSDAMRDRAEEQQEWEELQNLGDFGSSGGDSSGDEGGSGGPSGRTW